MKLKLFSLVAAFALLSSSVASAATYTTGASALPSSLTFDLFLLVPDEENEGEFIEIPLTTIGPLGINGSTNATVAVDGGGNGSLAFGGSSLVMDDGGGFVDIPGFGSFDLNFAGVGISLTSDPIDVSSGVWDLDLTPPTSFSLSLNQGSLVVDNVSPGLIALGLEDPTIIDLSTDPVALSLEDLAGFGIFGGASDTDVSLVIPGVTIDIGEAALELPGLLFLRIDGEVNVSLVPEPATYALLGMGILGMIPVVRRRLRK